MFLITGATGNVGTEVVSALADAGERVRALVHRPDAPLPDGVEPVVGDLSEPDSLTDAFQGVQGIFLMSGYSDSILARAREAGVRRVVLLSGGSAELEDLDNAISRYMTLTERAVRASGLSWTFLRPRAFMSNALAWRPQLQAGDTVRAQFPKVRAARVDPRDIGEVAARALTDERHDGRIYNLTGPESLLPAELVAVLAEVLGRNLRCVELSNDETRAELQQGTPPEYIDAFFNFYVDGTLDEATIHPDVSDVTGRPARTFRQWAETHAARFRSAG
ncbi:NAD(P)H-binding protein [Amycolatopsis sp. GM8]|uniref:NAD(P)H-binding protein n=1 Tax=Amycolatopsis sp. GM8 TaxID=2896530 RepID=UPI001F2D1590|nr:NAD(P)H-binding protein [Amycolatopsis sp. GM8]